jgi:hypothetical protein
MLLFCSCNDYLSIVPDDIPSMEHVFNSHTTTEQFLFTCYSYLPNPADLLATQGMMSSRECWFRPEGWYWLAGDSNGGNFYTWHIARGLQNSNNPYTNYWDGGQGGIPLFNAIRDCNIFLENIDNAVDVEPYEKKRWTAEVKFLKAFYHYYLMRMYGPIPVIRENIPVGALTKEVQVYREPLEDVANYIVSLLDEAYSEKELPASIINEAEELGRITKPIVLSIKAQVLTLMASPLFNGNPTYRNFADKRGILLFPQEYNPDKWRVAAEALKAAINCAENEDNRSLFRFEDPMMQLSPALQQELTIRDAITERWNNEIIWASTKSEDMLQRLSTVPTSATDSWMHVAAVSPTLDVAELFYTDNGLPIQEDKEYLIAYPDIYVTSKATAVDADYIREGFETANLHFHREPRFYASLTFDGGYYFGNGNVKRNIDMKYGTTGGKRGPDRYSITGYFPKKLVNRESVYSSNGWTSHFYTYPYIRLADLYLLYAEVLNEVKATPDEEVYYYIDKVRERAGLKGVEETWNSTVSIHPEYIANKDRMRDIIHRERLIELAFENTPYWDILRWKEGEKRWNGTVRGWNVNGKSTDSFYNVTTIGTTSFSYKDYLTPISLGSLDRNTNLVQNPGW